MRFVNWALVANPNKILILKFKANILFNNNIYKITQYLYYY